MRSEASVWEISTQVLPRDLHAEYSSALAMIATSIRRMATEIRGLQKSEQREVEEFFAKVKDLQLMPPQAQSYRL